MRLLLLFILCVLAVPAMAQQQITFANLTPAGFCQLTLSGTAAGLSTCTGGIPVGSSNVFIIDETANSRWRDDGTAPTTTVGMLFSSGTSLSYQGDLTAIQFIAVSGSPVLDISFYKNR